MNKGGKGKERERATVIREARFCGDSTDLDETVWLVPGGDEQKDMAQPMFSWTGSDHRGKTLKDQLGDWRSNTK